MLACTSLFYDGYGLVVPKVEVEGAERDTGLGGEVAENGFDFEVSFWGEAAWSLDDLVLGEDVENVCVDDGVVVVADVSEEMARLFVAEPWKAGDEPGSSFFFWE